MQGDEFKGHQFVKINRAWVFDKTTFICYKVTIKNSEIASYTKAFSVGRDKDGDFRFDRIIEHIPVRVMRKVVSIITEYRKEALLGN